MSRRRQMSLVLTHVFPGLRHVLPRLRQMSPGLRHVLPGLRKALLSTTALVGTAVAATPPAASVTFVACPVYRDTDNGRKSGCWLATDPATGIRYDVTQSRSKPQMGREILVEGLLATSTNDNTSTPVLASGQAPGKAQAPAQGMEQPPGAGPPPAHEPGADDPCGGAVIAPVHVSVLTSTCPSFMLPAEGHPGRRFHLDPTLVLPPSDVMRPPLPPPYPPRDWIIEFSYQSDFLQYQYSEVILDEIARYVLASHPRRVEVIGHAVTQTRVVSEHSLAEQSPLARARAEIVAEALRRLGVTDTLMRVAWNENPPAIRGDDGLPEPSRRRVDIRVIY
jgi:outer membrane protein OmpA-like peptidoglycan-associated protein